MKSKIKMVALVEIAIVLCSVFLVAIPAIAAKQTAQKASASRVTTASGDDYVLDIYGNANEDDTIDMGDVVYTKLAIFGKKPKTELCDAKYDGRINVLDVIQTKLIILGKEKELTLIDMGYDERIVTVKKPLKRIVLLGSPKNLETLRSLGVEKDRVVGVHTRIQNWKAFFPEYQDKPRVSAEDLESTIDLDPDAVSICPGPGVFVGEIDKKRDVLESAGITVFVFRYSQPETYLEEITKLGYIYGIEEAREFLDFYQGIITNTIKERVEKIPEDDKPKVYMETYSAPYKLSGKFIEMTGGKNILPGTSGSVDPEAVIKGDPDIIVKKATWTVCGYDKDVDDTAGIENVREEIMSRPELQNVKAVKTGKVYAIANQLSCSGSSCGCRYFLQIAYLAKWFHPELFKDIDPKSIHQEYITRFHGLDIDLDEKGVFVYPEPS